MKQEPLFKQYKGVFDEEDLEMRGKQEKSARPKNNFFALPDAVGQKDAKAAWLQYILARKTGLEPEMLHANIAGKVRDMLLSAKASVEELQMHSFVYKKAKSDFSRWNRQELQEFYDKLVFIYHEARMAGTDLDIGIEKTLLTIGTRSESKRAPRVI